MRNYSGIDKDKEYIIEKLNLGWSAYKLSKVLPYSKSTILRFIHNNNVVNKNTSKIDKENLLKNNTDHIIYLRKQNKSNVEIAKATGFSVSQISKLLSQLNLQRDWKYKVKEDFFSEIKTEEQAYILGWFYSDGCVDNSGKCRIQIQQEDESVIYQIKDILGYSGPIYEIPPPKKFPNRKAQVCLSINRQALAQDLKKWGCVPNKSLILEYPRWIDSEIENHFLRGVFDGDGSVTLRKDKYLGCSITTTDNFNLELKKRLDLLGIESNIYYRRKNKNTCSLQITKHGESKKFLDYLYSNASIYLQRKFKVYNTL